MHSTVSELKVIKPVWVYSAYLLKKQNRDMIQRGKL